MEQSSAKVRVLIATTQGPLDVVFLDREPAIIEESFVVLPTDRFTRCAPLPRAYNSFVSHKTGLIGRLYRHDTFRLMLSGRIDEGFSWQLGVLIAHALEAAGRLAEGEDAADALVFATGEVGWGDLHVNSVGRVERKLTEAFDRLKAERAADRRVICIWPRDNSDEAAPLRTALLALGIEIIEAVTAADALVAIGLAVPVLERVMAADASRPVWTGSPFRGLEVFDAEHRPVFFGRTQGREEARESLQQAAARDCAFLLVYGTSGSGKSSLVRAGLLGDIAEFASEAAVWREAIVVTGQADAGPLGVLSGVLLAAVPELNLDETSLLARLREAPGAVADAVTMALRPGTAVGPEKLIFVVDQIEDVLLWAHEQGSESAQIELQQFVATLDALARCGTVWVIATLRSDLLPLLDEIPSLSRLASNERRYALRAPSRAELREIVQRPAEVAGLRLEGKDETGLALVDMLVEAVAANPESLPLLQFALARLYDDEGRSGKISVAAYKRMGAIEGAIGRHADATIKHMGPAPNRERAVEDVLLALARTDRQGGRMVARSARLDWDLGTPERSQVVDALEAARLVVKASAVDATGAKTTMVRVAHEALLTHWPLTQQVFKDHAGMLDLRDRLQIAAEDWLAQSRDETYLLRAGRPLASAQDLISSGRVGLSASTATYVDASAEKAKVEAELEVERAAAAQTALEQRRLEREAEQARQLADAQAVAAANRRVAQRTGIGLIAALVLAGSAIGFGVYARHERKLAAEQRDRAEHAVTKAIEAANSLTFDLAEKFQFASGVPIEVVKSILDQALKLGNELAGSGENSPTLQSSRADTLALLAQTFASLGFTSDARNASEKAVNIVRILFQKNPGDKSTSKQLVRLLRTLGSIQIRTQDLKGARASFEEALDIQRKLSTNQMDIPAQKQLSAVLDGLGRIASDEEGYAIYQECLDISRRVARADPGDESQYGLAFFLNKMGSIKSEKGDISGSLSDLREAQVILRRLMDNPRRGDSLH